MDEVFSNIKNSPVDPVHLTPESKFNFRCHKDISCFNKCCGDLDIFLTPYDIIRIKNSLKITSSQLLDNHTRQLACDLRVGTVVIAPAFRAVTSDTHLVQLSPVIEIRRQFERPLEFTR